MTFLLLSYFSFLYQVIEKVPMSYFAAQQQLLKRIFCACQTLSSKNRIALPEINTIQIAFYILFIKSQTCRKNCFRILLAFTLPCFIKLHIFIFRFINLWHIFLFSNIMDFDFEAEHKLL